MFSDLPNEHSPESPLEDVSVSGIQPLPVSPFAVQLQNIFPVEITTKRFPVDKAVDLASVMPSARLRANLGDMGVDTEALQAQVSLEVHVSFPPELRLFEIYFKLVGIFNYRQDYQLEMVQQFLQQGSLGVMLPSARELLLSLCTRLQVPMIVLPLMQLAPFPSSIDIEVRNTSQK
jgi:preprotein translocase subunit SecB